MADTRLKIAVFIDFDNIEIGVKNTLNTQFDIGVVLEALRERGDVVSKIAYSDWSRAGDYSRTLTQHATKLVQRNLTPGGDKNGADINLALDALEMAFTHPHINAYVIVGGDSDFITLVEKLKQYDKQIFVVGGRSFTSYVMQRNCHEFIAYENLISSSKRPSSDRGGRPTGGGAQAPVEQVVPLVRRALKILSDREVSPQLGLLKSTLLQLDSTFSERTYGVSSFRDFADKLAAAGHVTVREMGRNVVVELTESGAAGGGSEDAGLTQVSEVPAGPQPPASPQQGQRDRDRDRDRGQGRRDQGSRDQGPRDPSPQAPAQEPRVAEGVSEVRRLFQSAQQPPRWPMYVRQAKQFMRNVDATFDERKFGFASIVDLLRACQRDGLFRIERDRQGVMRLFQGNVMQAASDGTGQPEQPTTPGAPRPWQPGDDIPDIHDADRPVEAAPEVVEGDVVREIEMQEILDGQPASDEEPEPDAKKGRGRGGRAKPSREPKAAKAPRAKKTAAPRAPRAKATRAKKATAD
ncbi:MAG: NYN domain-containing protein [Acidobacteria bacterium]|nr:NYN domain-containing protein [Acidobacteriota bacterium]